jgi:hypothetical protein
MWWWEGSTNAVPSPTNRLAPMREVRAQRCVQCKASTQHRLAPHTHVRARTHTHTRTHAHSACITTTTTLTVHTLHGHDAHPQDTWARVQLGPVLMELVKPCSRCQVPTIDQETGERRSRYEPIRTLRTFRGFGENVYVGENAVQLNLGSIAVGDSVDIVERREARRYGKAEDPKE